MLETHIRNIIKDGIYEAVKEKRVVNYNSKNESWTKRPSDVMIKNLQEKYNGGGSYDQLVRLDEMLDRELEKTKIPSADELFPEENKSYFNEILYTVLISIFLISLLALIF